MRGLSAAAVKRYYNPVAVSFTEWGNWEQAIVKVMSQVEGNEHQRTSACITHTHKTTIMPTPPAAPTLQHPQAIGKRKTLLMTYPQAEASGGLFSNLRSVLGEQDLLWVACPERPDVVRTENDM